ncbi:MAG: YdeI/OmpD-associated family protein [Anaerolineales bacterium]|jgi:hypothetical protein
MGIRKTFKAAIENAGGGGAFVRIPFDVEQVFGKKRVKVKATIEGEPYRGTLVRMGEPDHILIILKGIREEIGRTFGDEVEITLEEDTEPRRVEVPPDFQQALDRDPSAKAAFQKLAYTHQREIVRGVTEAKREATRRSRIIKAIEMLKIAKKSGVPGPIDPVGKEEE